MAETNLRCNEIIPVDKVGSSVGILVCLLAKLESPHERLQNTVKYLQM